MRRTAAPAAALAAILAATVVLAVPAAADHRPAGHTEPAGPAKWAFAPDVPRLPDSEWGFDLGGFGGIERGAPLSHVPVIFVHGNNVDHADWYSVRDDFRAAGWTDQELWALSYNGVGATIQPTTRPDQRVGDEHAEMGGDGRYNITANDLNVPDLAAFIRMVQDYTGSRRVSLVGHSLGVTIARKTMLVHPDLAADVVGFVGIAGANHGTSLCPPGSEESVSSCDEIAAGTAWLDELNGPEGSLETYGPTRWLTIYDGTGAGDVAFVGPTYAQSPLLEGADNREFPLVGHNDLRVDPAIVTAYREFLEDAEAASAPAVAPPGAPGAASGAPSSAGPADAGTLPATGGGVSLAVASLLAGAAVRRRGRR